MPRIFQQAQGDLPTQGGPLPLSVRSRPFRLLSTKSCAYRTTLPRSDFPQSGFRAEHDPPFEEQPVALLRRFETAFCVNQKGAPLMNTRKADSERDRAMQGSTPSHRWSRNARPIFNTATLPRFPSHRGPPPGKARRHTSRQVRIFPSHRARRPRGCNSGKGSCHGRPS